MLVYLASPIDHCGRQPGFDSVRDLVIRTLKEQGAAVFAPNHAWSLNVDLAGLDALDRLSDVNFFALEQSDLVLALAPTELPSVGVPIEVYHTLTNTDAKVALWLGEGRLGAMYAHLIANHGDRIKLLPKDLSETDVWSALNWANEALCAIDESAQ